MTPPDQLDSRHLSFFAAAADHSNKARPPGAGAGAGSVRGKWSDRERSPVLVARCPSHEPDPDPETGYNGWRRRRLFLAAEILRADNRKPLAGQPRGESIMARPEVAGLFCFCGFRLSLSGSQRA